MLYQSSLFALQTSLGDFLGSPVVKIKYFQGKGAQSEVGELRSHSLRSTAKKIFLIKIK